MTAGLPQAASPWLLLTQLRVCSFPAAAAASRRAPPCRHTSLKVCGLGPRGLLQATRRHARVTNLCQSSWPRFCWFLKASASSSSTEVGSAVHQGLLETHPPLRKAALAFNLPRSTSQARCFYPGLDVVLGFLCSLFPQ